MPLKKQNVRTVIFEKYYDQSCPISFRFSDLPKDLLPTDIIVVEPGGNEEGEDALVQVHRERMETDEEFEKRKEFWAGLSAKSKEERREQYLKLKKEFESEQP